MKPIFKHIFIGTAMMLVLGYVVFSIWYFTGNDKEEVCKILDIDVIDYRNVQLITESEVALILDQADLNPVGKTIKHVSTESIEETLRKNPMLKSVECYKTPSGIVYVRIEQRSPKLRVVGNVSYYVDNDRKPMPVSQNCAAYIPVVSGRVTVTMATSTLFDFVTFLEDNPFWNSQIEQIYVRDDLKIELVPRVGDAIILLGSLDHFQLKLEKLHKLYVRGFNTIGWNRYQTIDLQYKNQVVCTKVGVSKEKPVLIDNSLKDSIIASKL